MSFCFQPGLLEGLGCLISSPRGPAALPISSLMLQTCRGFSGSVEVPDRLRDLGMEQCTPGLAARLEKGQVCPGDIRTPHGCPGQGLSPEPGQGQDTAHPVPLALHPEKSPCYLWCGPKRSPGADKGAEVHQSDTRHLLRLLSCLHRGRTLQIRNVSNLQPLQ